jgi:TfoX/Sxy family transcriptional regulator of competence genes
MSCLFGTEVNEEHLLAIKKLQFDELVSYLKVYFQLLPDYRKGHNTTYTIQDAALSAFSVFFTQSPSFLAHQKKMQETKGRNNAHSLFQIENIPSDNQTRNLLDPVEPKHLTPIFEFVYKNLLMAGFIEPYRYFNNTILIALDGVCYHSSSEVSCDKCHKREHKNGQITYMHSVITPVIVAPGNPHVISLPPEFITPQDGHEKQDSEHAATKRWLKQHAKTYKELGVTFLGDDLYDCQPICQAMLDEQCHFILTCKPDSHKTLYQWVSELDVMGKVTQIIVNWRHGKKCFVDTYRFINQVPLRDSDDALLVNWCELVTTNETGKVTYKNAFVTDHLITEKNIIDIVKAGRARWKIENENNNTLKTKGYNLEHNFGHGKEYLSQLLLTMNLLAFLYHTVLHFIDTAYQLIRAKLSTRKIFFDGVRELTRYMYFDNWQHLMKFMMTGLEIELPDSG